MQDVGRMLARYRKIPPEVIAQMREDGRKSGKTAIFYQ